MRKLLLISCVAALLIVSFPILPAAVAEELSLLVYVIDCAAVPSATLNSAEHAMTLAFGSANVRARWREVRTAPPPNLEPNHVTVVLLSPEMSDQKIAKDRISPYALATAAPSARRAWVFYERVEDAARNQRVSIGTALGTVIAHEVAHAAAALPHTPRGIMSEELRVMADGFAGFSDDQGRLLHTAMRTAADRARRGATLALNRRSPGE